MHVRFRVVSSWQIVDMRVQTTRTYVPFQMNQPVGVPFLVQFRNKCIFATVGWRVSRCSEKKKCVVTMPRCHMTQFTAAALMNRGIESDLQQGVIVQLINELRIFQQHRGRGIVLI